MFQRRQQQYENDNRNPTPKPNQMSYGMQRNRIADTLRE